MSLVGNVIGAVAGNVIGAVTGNVAVVPAVTVCKVVSQRRKGRWHSGRPQRDG